MGSLVKARGREWVVLPESTDRLLQVRPLGAPDLETTSFLTALERIEPATFALPDPENLGDLRSARLLREAVRLGFRSAVGPFRSLAGIAVEPRPYQLVPLLMALRQNPVRLLIADDVGIGKTVEAALVAKEMLARAAAMLPTKMAKDAGYDQVLWTDAHTHTHVEESGATNIAFVVKGALVTPPLSDTILDGVTRDSVITLARELGIEVQERPLSIDEITNGIHDGSVTEAFGIGTAASVAAIGKIGIDGVDYELPVVNESVAGRLRDSLNAIRFGQVADPYGWMTTVDPL